MKCVQCASQRIARNVRIREGSHSFPIIVQTFDEPDATFCKGKRSYRASANICSDCGYLMLTVPKNDAQKIYETNADR